MNSMGIESFEQPPTPPTEEEKEKVEEVEEKAEKEEIEEKPVEEEKPAVEEEKPEEIVPEEEKEKIEEKSPEEEKTEEKVGEEKEGKTEKKPEEREREWEEEKNKEREKRVMEYMDDEWKNIDWEKISRHGMPTRIDVIRDYALEKCEKSGIEGRFWAEKMSSILERHSQESERSHKLYVLDEKIRSEFGDKIPSRLEKATRRKSDELTRMEDQYLKEFCVVDEKIMELLDSRIKGEEQLKSLEKRIEEKKQQEEKEREEREKEKKRKEEEKEKKIKSFKKEVGEI